MKYKVYLVRRLVFRASVEVEANSEDDAYEKACRGPVEWGKAIEYQQDVEGSEECLRLRKAGF